MVSRGEEIVDHRTEERLGKLEEAITELERIFKIQLVPVPGKTSRNINRSEFASLVLDNHELRLRALEEKK